MSDEVTGKELLISLADFNETILRRNRECPKRPVNGIACPQCGKELVDTQPTNVRLSTPMQKTVACDSCGFTGNRLV